MDKKLILFDFDGTLFDTSPGIIRCLHIVFEQNGVESHSDQWMYRFIGPPLRAAFREFCGMSEEQATEVHQEYRKLYAKEGVFDCKLIDGAKECVADLRTAGFKTAVATCKPQIFAEQILERYSFDKHFDFVSGVHEPEDTKADVIAAALKGLNIDASQAIMVGDRKYDVYGAKTFNIPCICLNGPFAEEGEFEKAGAYAVVENFAELTKFFLEK